MVENNSKKRKKSPRYITERIKIEKLVPGGQALATLKDGKKIFLWNALPGEIVTEVEVWKNKSHFVEGAATEFETTSSHRIDVHDDCYLSTSPWQIMDYEYELAEKREILQEIFHQQKIAFTKLNDVVQTSTNFPAVETDNHDFFYRNKMEYALYFDHDDQLIHLAFHSRGSHRKIPIQKSSLERPEILAKAQEIIDELNFKHEDARKFQSLILRCNQNGEVSGGLYENHQPHPHFSTLQDSILGQTYSYSVNGFFQINLPVYKMALHEIKSWVNTKNVLDLYAGVGTIGLSVAQNCDLTLVECNKSACLEMETNCRGKSYAKSILAKSEEAIEYIEPDQTVIIDPPRAGCEPKLLEKILEVLPERIIYLSCNPVTQARDVKILLEKYRIVKIQPYNFFPRTPHLENLIILQRQH